MRGRMTRHVIWLTAIALTLAIWRIGSAQLEGMEPPTDVTGADCRMCHTDFALNLTYPHPPAEENNCTACHLTTGETGHGGLINEGRTLCLECHQDKVDHNPAATCWSTGCHSDVHGSDVEPFFIASRLEEYPGFNESTTDAEYIGSSECLSCHTDKCESWSQSMHSLADGDHKLPPERQGCEACHGPGSHHYGRLAGIGRFDYAATDEIDTVCLKCHRDEMYVPDYTSSTHTKEHLSCVSCHNPHYLGEKANLRLAGTELCLSCHETKRTDFMRLSSHPVDLADPRTGMQCTECHNPHGSAERAMLTAPADEFCQRCHADKAGPFVFSHPGYDPALGNGCSTCHAAHGSNAPNLLQISGRGLCLQCHTEMVNHGGGATCWTSGCHSQHHGSNSNFYFMD
jgi:DmsE family decaheme c-type cytochrome